MATLKEILDQLPQADKDLLNYAFEHEIPQFVRLPNNKFIGVNVGHMSYLIPEATAGVWSTGKDSSINHNHTKNGAR